MNSKAVSLVALVVVLSAVCLAAPAAEEDFGAGGDRDFKAVVEFLLRNAEPRPTVSPAMADEYKHLSSCYNGVFSALKLHDHHEHIDVEQEPLYQHCRANRDRLLESLWYNVDETFGVTLLMPVYPISFFEKFVTDRNLEEKSLKEQLIEYQMRWTFQVERINHLDHCNKLINLIDVELAQWGLEEAPVVDYLQAKTKLPIGKALDICRVTKDL